jgi:type IV secretion system protein VirD4
MSLRPAVRREGPLDQMLLMILGILLGATFLLWLTGQVAGFVHSGHWPKVSLPEMGVVVTRVPRHPLDPAAAWPSQARGLLPGPVLFWLTFFVLLAILVAAWFFLSALLRSTRQRMGRTIVVERSAPAADQVGSTGWVRPQLFQNLYVRASTPWRVTLGRVNGRLVAAEPLQSVIALGPTQSQKTSGLTIPAILEWDGPVLAACVKPDLIRSTIGPRYGKGDVFVYDPTGATGMETNTWSPLPRIYEDPDNPEAAADRTWRGAYRMALSMVEASRLAGRDTEAVPGAATNLLAAMLLAATLSGRAMSDVLRWAQRHDENDIKTAIEVGHIPAAADAFESIRGMTEQHRSQVYTQVLGVISAYTDPTIKEASRGTRFDAERLLNSVADTAYVTLPAHEQRRFGPLAVALVQDVIELAIERSRKLEAPIDPALLVVLDDAASSAALPQLDMYAATAGGYGIQLVTAFRHLSQMQVRYGDRAEAVFANHRAKVILSGVTDLETLTLLSHLLGDETVRQLATPAALAKAGKDRGGEAEAAARSAARSRGASPAEALGWISPGHGVLLYGHLPPAPITLRPWFRDRQLQAMVNPTDASAGRHRASR